MTSTFRVRGLPWRIGPAWRHHPGGFRHCSPQIQPLRRCKAQKSGIELALEELRASQSFDSKRVAAVRSWGFLGACTLVAATSLFSFNLLSEEIASAAIQQGYTGASENLLILDLRDGYTPTTVSQAFEAWGGKGICAQTCFTNPANKHHNRSHSKGPCNAEETFFHLHSECVSADIAENQRHDYAWGRVPPQLCTNAPLPCRQSFVRPNRASGRHLLCHRLPWGVHGRHQQAAIGSVHSRSRGLQLVGALPCCAGGC